MLLNGIQPGLFLREYVRLYRIIDFQFPAQTPLPFKMYPPRPEHCLQFYPKDTETIQYSDKKQSIANKKATLLGQHTIINQRYVGRNFLVFQIVWQPGALYRITGIPALELTNVCIDAMDVMGADVAFVNEQLAEAKSYGEMTLIIERFLHCLIKSPKIKQHPIDTVSMKMLQQDDLFSVDGFLREACLSHRQFDRRFLQSVGIPPKQYLQVIRFDQAFRMKNRHPTIDWETVAIHCGYYDYQHLAKEYKTFTGFTPNQFLQIENQAPERRFGEKEI